MEVEVLAKGIRVYELARDLDIESKEALRILQEELNLDVSNHMATVNDKVAERVRQIVEGEEPAQETIAEVDEQEESVDEETTPRQQDTTEAEHEDEQPSQQETDPGQTSQQQEQPQQLRQSDSDGLHVPVNSVTLSGAISVGDLAETLQIDPIAFMQHLVSMGIMANINQELDLESAALIVGELGVEFDLEEGEDQGEKSHRQWQQRVAEHIAEDDPENQEQRAPVVTVLGHVDHGKTTLLDTMRETAVAEREAGGITQHIGASLINHEGKNVVFLDTPGHEAFTAMRSRGAHATDIAVLVVDSVDGVMPQTVEAVNHAKSAGVPIIVAVNKIDLPGAQPDRIRQELTAQELVPEEWGGETIYVDISAEHGENIDELLEMITLVAEMEEIKADPDKRAHGVVIESEIEKGRGPVATVLIQGGTLKIADPFIVGIYDGRVRALFDQSGDRIDEADPSTPVEVLGSSEVPEAGDLFVVMEDDAQARELAEQLQEEERENALEASSAVSLEEFYQGEEDTPKELRIVLKADVDGSLQACSQSLENIKNEEVTVRVLHSGVGGINESDVMLASASEAIIVGFNVRPNAGARNAAEEEDIEIRTYRVIYEMIEDIEKAITGMLAPEFREVVIGRAEVRDTFQVSGIGMIAGLYVTDGEIRRNADVRVVRDGRVIHEGSISSLKRFEDDVRQVSSGYECGLGVANFNDVKVGDRLEVFVEEEVPRG